MFFNVFLDFFFFYAPASAKHPQTNRGSPFTEKFPSFAQLPLPPGPERNLAVGNLDKNTTYGVYRQKARHLHKHDVSNM